MDTYRGFLCGLYPDMSPCRDKRVAGSATGGVSRDSAASNAATAATPARALERDVIEDANPTAAGPTKKPT
jgi:hypothetical protein